MGIILETERLLLREFELPDAEAFYRLNNDFEVLQYTGDLAFNTVKEAEDLIRNYVDYAQNGFGRNTVVLKSTAEVIGWCGLKKHSNGMIDLGYRLFRREWNKGYATESSKAIVAFGFTNYGIHEIVGRTAAKNLSSIRVLEKIGMQFWKKEACEGIKDSLFYKIDHKEWQKSKINQ